MKFCRVNISPKHLHGQKEGGGNARVGSKGVECFLPTVWAHCNFLTKMLLWLGLPAFASLKNLAAPHLVRYHQRCIDQWLCRNAECPICKQKLNSSGRGPWKGGTIWHLTWWRSVTSHSWKQTLVTLADFGDCPEGVNCEKVKVSVASNGLCLDT